MNTHTEIINKTKVKFYELEDGWGFYLKSGSMSCGWSLDGAIDSANGEYLWVSI